MASVEQQFIRGLRLGLDVDLTSVGGERSQVQASDLRAAFIAVGWACDPRPITISGCDFAGALDLRNFTIGVSVTFEDCTFDSAVRLEGASVEALAFVSCPLITGILANGCVIRHDLLIERSIVQGAHRTIASMRQTAAIWLCEAQLGGRLLIRDGSVVDGLGGRSVHADRIKVAANVRILDGSQVRGEFRLFLAQVAGSLDIVSSSMTADDQVAVELAEAHFGGSVLLTRTANDAPPTSIDGLLVMSDVTVGAFLSIRGSVLLGRVLREDSPYGRPSAERGRRKSVGEKRNMHKLAIMAPRCEIGDDLHIDGDTSVDGGLMFPHAVVLGDVLLDDLAITNPGDRSLDLGSAEISGGLIAREAKPQGTVWLAGCQVSGSLVLERCIFVEPDGPALVMATGMNVGGDLQLAGLQTFGGSLRFRAVSVGGEVGAQEVVLNNPGGETASFSNARINGAVRLIGSESTGLLTINRASVGGRLHLSGAKLLCQHRWEKNVHGHALEIISSQLGGGMYLDWAECMPSVDLFSSTTTIVADDTTTWAENSELSGFTYERFDAAGPRAGDPWEVDARLKILESQKPFDLGPYEVAARVYSEHGRFAEADRIRVAGRRRASNHAFELAWENRSFPRRAWALVVRSGDWLYRQSVGYGYKPGRALGLIAILTVMVGFSLVAPGSGGERVLRAVGASDTVYSPDGPLSETELGAYEVCGGDVRCFQPTIYAIETVVPLINLDQRSTWYVDSTSNVGRFFQMWLTFATVAGWTLSSVFVLSFSRLGRTS